MFGLALLTVYFTLENTAASTVHILPSFSVSLPLAALLLIAAGVGAFGAWLFAGWSVMLRDVDAREIESSKKRIQELEMDLTVTSGRKKILPFMKFATGKDIDKDVA
ncbi:hypothetical protein EV05_0903 [Prochlorococcus sp. MIT 0601]|nr:hypothetical protein EV05_0903 [Prochlorococcus sp. MIT 0601]